MAVNDEPVILKDIKDNESEINQLEDDIKSIEEFQESDEYKEYLNYIEKVKRTMNPELKAKREQEINQKYEHILDSTPEAIQEKREKIKLIKEEISIQVTKHLKDMETKKSEIAKNIKEFEEKINLFSKSISDMEKEITDDKDKIDEKTLFEKEALIAGKKAMCDKYVEKLEQYKAELEKTNKSINRFKKKYNMYIKKDEPQEVKDKGDEKIIDATDTKKEPKDEPKKEPKEVKYKNIGSNNEAINFNSNTENVLDNPKKEDEIYIAVQRKIADINRGNGTLNDKEAALLMEILSDENAYAKYGIRTKGYFSRLGFNNFGNEARTLMKAIGRYTKTRAKEATDIFKTIENKSLVKNPSDIVDNIKNDKELSDYFMDSIPHIKELADKKSENKDIDWDVNKVLKQVIQNMESASTLSEKDKENLEKLQEIEVVINNFNKTANVFNFVDNKNIRKYKNALTEEHIEEDAENKPKERSLEDELRDDVEPGIVEKNIPIKKSVKVIDKEKQK